MAACRTSETDCRQGPRRRASRARYGLDMQIATSSSICISGDLDQLSVVMTCRRLVNRIL